MNHKSASCVKRSTWHNQVRKLGVLVRTLRSANEGLLLQIFPPAIEGLLLRTFQWRRRPHCHHRDATSYAFPANSIQSYRRIRLVLVFSNSRALPNMQ